MVEQKNGNKKDVNLAIEENQTEEFERENT